MGFWLSINISDRLSATCGDSGCCLSGDDHMVRKVGSLAIFRVVVDRVVVVVRMLAVRLR
jgi:hypothetical protein